MQSIGAVAQSSEMAYGRIKDYVTQTLCLGSRVHEGLFFKTENFQKTGSFKFRGATAKLSSLGNEVPVITASSGNHGIACSQAAVTTGHDLTVVLPESVARVKLSKIQSFGVKTILHPGDSGRAERHARTLAEEAGFTYVSPYNDPEIIAGQGTIGIEMLAQLSQVDNVFISLGGGGLVSGVGAVLKIANPKVRIFGVSAIHSAALAASIRAGKIVETEHLETLADGCAGGVDEDAMTLPLAATTIDDLIECSEAEITQALCALAWEESLIVEGAAALAYAGYLKQAEELAGQTSVVLLCGGNIDKARLHKILCET
ncbi:MAG: pyridoxal-phosphate dependent enzyme [Paracoccaceae bacterium]